MWYRCVAASLLMFLSSVVYAQPGFGGLEHLFSTPRNYTVCFTNTAPSIDGDIREDVWEKTEWTNSFLDIEGNKKPVPRLQTKVKMLWNKSCLFIAAELEEPDVWATLKKRDEVVFHDNDFEVFIDPQNNTHNYFEIEVNALNTIFDLFLAKPYRNNSGALIGWNASSMKTAVKINGTLNNAGDKDKSWTVEMAIPFAVLTIGNEVKVPSDSELWRINFSRVEWDTDVRQGKYVKRKDDKGRLLPEHNWVWSPQGIVNMHYPERWGYLLFTTKEAGSSLAPFILPYAEKQKQYLWLVYYRQKDYHDKNRKYAKDLVSLGIDKPLFNIDGKQNVLNMQGTDSQFSATIQCKGLATLRINDEGLVETVTTNI